MSPEDIHQVFIPGRLCLFGEHSDWAGGYRSSIPGIDPGCCLICGTNQGLHARIQKADDCFELRSDLPDGTTAGPFRIPFQEESLLASASGAGFEAYSAGTACQVCRNYSVQGLSIDVFKMDLPLQKGLSSSAAVCVLTARAFNLAYGLNLDVTTEMDLAYRGELLAGSACGRMDQACAYGSRPVFLTFDGDLMTVELLSPAKDIHLLIVDLDGRKDTRIILSSLNQAFLQTNSASSGIRYVLGEHNRRILEEARQAVNEGCASAIGRLMMEAQQQFDEIISPLCLRELTAPRLHSLLNDPHLKEISLGGKGVGSQGDGCAQFVFDTRSDQDGAARYIEGKYRMTCYPMIIPRFQRSK